MKKIDELTELEIYGLTDEDVNSMITYRKAEEGIIFLDNPELPNYTPVSKPDLELYSLGLLEKANIWFENKEEVIQLISFIRNLNSYGRVSYDYNISDSDTKYFTKNIKEYSNDPEPENFMTKCVYSKELYNEVSKTIKENKKIKENYEKLKKEYDSMMNDANWISEDIWERVNVVRHKFWKMEKYFNKFINEYMPIASNNFDIAMGFLDKAYSLNDDEKSYIQEKYDN